MDEKNKRDEYEIYKCSVGISYGLKLQMNVKSIELVMERIRKLLFEEDILPWLFDNVTGFFINAKVKSISADEDECFASAGKLKGSSSYMIYKIYKEIVTEYEYEMPYKQENDIGMLYNSPFEKDKLKVFTTVAGVEYEREDFNVIARNAEEAIEIVMKTISHTDFIKWKSDEITSFYIDVDEREDFTDDATFSCEATRVSDDGFEVTEKMKDEYEKKYLFFHTNNAEALL